MSSAQTWFNMGLQYSRRNVGVCKDFLFCNGSCIVLFFCFVLGLQGEYMIETMTEIVMVEGIEIEKDKDKSILTDMSIGDLMTTTIGAMMMTLTIGVVKGGCTLQSDGASSFL